jgi:hypothetical protein
MVDILIVAIILVTLGGAAFYVYRAKKKGAKCIGCPSAKKCGGNCANCSCGCMQK